VPVYSKTRFPFSCAFLRFLIAISLPLVLIIWHIESDLDVLGVIDLLNTSTSSSTLSVKWASVGLLFCDTLLLAKLVQGSQAHWLFVVGKIFIPLSLTSGMRFMLSVDLDSRQFFFRKHEKKGGVYFTNHFFSSSNTPTCICEGTIIKEYL